MARVRVSVGVSVRVRDLGLEFYDRVGPSFFISSKKGVASFVVQPVGPCVSATRIRV